MSLMLKTATRYLVVCKTVGKLAGSNQGAKKVFFMTEEKNLEKPGVIYNLATNGESFFVINYLSQQRKKTQTASCFHLVHESFKMKLLKVTPTMGGDCFFLQFSAFVTCFMIDLFSTESHRTFAQYRQEYVFSMCPMNSIFIGNGGLTKSLLALRHKHNTCQIGSSCLVSLSSWIFRTFRSHKLCTANYCCPSSGHILFHLLKKAELQ